MTETEQLKEITDKITGYLGDWDNHNSSTNDTMYHLLEMRYILEHMIDTPRDDKHLTFNIVQTFYALNMTMSKILANEAEEIDRAANYKLSLSRVDLSWKKEE